MITHKAERYTTTGYPKEYTRLNSPENLALSNWGLEMVLARLNMSIYSTITTCEFNLVVGIYTVNGR